MASIDKAQNPGSYRIGLEPRRSELVPKRSGDPAMHVQSTSLVTRILYAMVLLVSVIPIGSGWVALAAGATSWAGPATILVWILAVYRAVLVLARPATLDAPCPGGWLAWCRRLGLGLVATGLALSASRFFVRPLGHLLAPHGSDNGIEYFIVGLVIAVLATLAPMGLLVFEFSRLRGFELALRAQRA
jgi:hypothetical protein